MTKRKNNNDHANTEYPNSGFSESLPYLTALFAGFYPECQADGLTIQRSGDGNYRLILRGSRDTASGDTDYVVSFTNADDWVSGLELVDYALKWGNIRWSPDKYRSEAAKKSSQRDAKRDKPVVLMK